MVKATAVDNFGFYYKDSKTVCIYKFDFSNIVALYDKYTASSNVVTLEFLDDYYYSLIGTASNLYIHDGHQNKDYIV